MNFVRDPHITPAQYAGYMRSLNSSGMSESPEELLKKHMPSPPEQCPSAGLNEAHICLPPKKNSRGF